MTGIAPSVGPMPPDGWQQVVDNLRAERDALVLQVRELECFKLLAEDRDRDAAAMTRLAESRGDELAAAKRQVSELNKVIAKYEADDARYLKVLGEKDRLKSEAEADRNRHKLALQLLVGAYENAEGPEKMAELVRVSRALLYGPEIDPTLLEKRPCGHQMKPPPSGPFVSVEVCGVCGQTIGTSK